MSAAGIEHAFSVSQDRVRELIVEHPAMVPTHTLAGTWMFEDGFAPGWTGGFLAGMMWIFAEQTGDAFWYENAKAYSRLLEPRRLDQLTHDIGFLFTPSWGHWYELEPSDEVQRVLIQAGRTMAQRFNPAGRYLRSFVDEGSTFIDIMMNVGIIYQAASLANAPELADIATAHALTSRRYLVRGDASTIHEGWFDPESGEFLRAATHQGYRSDSTWARGQAWAIYGFGTAFGSTRDVRFLDTARLCADFYISQTGTDFVCSNDWSEPKPELRYEASAASVAASGMLQLAELLGAAGSEYESYARHIVARLCEPDFLSSNGDGWEGIIKHSTYHRGKGLGVDESVMWGDYYFVEALARLAKLDSTLDRSIRETLAG